VSCTPGRSIRFLRLYARGFEKPFDGNIIKPMMVLLSHWPA
jgi:hypothetical protein